MKGTHTGLWIAIAALGVNAPRLVQAFLEADGLQLHGALRPVLMGSTGVAAALTLTGGGAWLAHEVARGSYQPGARLQGVLMACWVGVLLGQLVLLPPMLMAEMPSTRLGTVLTASWQRWAWAFTAVLLVELVAAGAMVAQGRRSLWQQEQEEVAAGRELERIARERNALEQRLRAEREQTAELRMLLSSVQSPGAAEKEQDARASLLPTSAPRGEQSPSSDAPGESTPCRHGCGWVGSSRRAENAHLRFCPLRPE